MSVQLTQVEKKRRKRFTAQQKLEILREWEATGNGVEVAERHGIHPMTLYRWRRDLRAASEKIPDWMQQRGGRRVQYE